MGLWPNSVLSLFSKTMHGIKGDIRVEKWLKKPFDYNVIPLPGGQRKILMGNKNGAPKSEGRQPRVKEDLATLKGEGVDLIVCFCEEWELYLSSNDYEVF